MSEWTVDVKGEVSVFYSVHAESEEDAGDAAKDLFTNDMDNLGAIVEEDTVSVVSAKALTVKGPCALCRSSADLKPDYERVTGRLRGLLCERCPVMVSLYERLPSEQQDSLTLNKYLSGTRA